MHRVWTSTREKWSGPSSSRPVPPPLPCILLPAMPPLPTQSRITRVVVHARGAVITRVVTLPPALPAEAFELLIPGLTPLAEPASFRALATGAREVVSVLARFVVPDGPVSKGSTTERIRSLGNERNKLNDERSHVVGRRNQLAGLSFNLGMEKRLRQTNPEVRLKDALAASKLVQGELAGLDARVFEIDAALEKLQRALAAAELDAAQARAEERQGTSRPTLACLVRLAAGQGALSALSLEYVVLGARWWPTYKAWLTKNATHVRLELDALIAQDSGEDWSDVEIALSTADLIHDARLPELASLRLGRAQPPQKRGYRPPPAGLDAMFEPYEVGMPRAVREAPPEPPPPPAPMRPTGAPSASYAAPQGFGAPPAAPGGGGMPMAMQSMPMPKPAAPPPPRAKGASAPRQEEQFKEEKKTRAREESVDRLASLGGAPRGGFAGFRASDESFDEGGSVSSPDIDEPEASFTPDDTWLDFDALVLIGAEDTTRRGRLSRLPEDASRRDANRARMRIDLLDNPTRTRDPSVTRGLFDHFYEAEGRGDVPSNARPHRVHVAAKDGPAKARFRVVPRESTDVYRESRIENPFGAPLLAGPVDVFLEGALITTTELGAVDRGGFVEVGLGVEERIRVARNARVEESTAGLLGGSAVVDHQVTLDLSSSLGLPVTVEILERIPVTDDKDVSIKVTAVEPEPEVYDQAEIGAPVRGGRRFRVEVPAGGKARASFAYRIKLPGKSEIVGGNRRE